MLRLQYFLILSIEVSPKLYISSLLLKKNNQLKFSLSILSENLKILHLTQ